MSDPKLWLDLSAAFLLVTVGSMINTPNNRSTFLFKVLPISMGVLLAMSQAKAIF